MGLADELDTLARLRAEGALSEEEFVAAKTRLLTDAPTETMDDVRQARQVPNGVNLLRRSTRDRWLGGVCGGIASFSGIESWVWRLLWTVTVFFAGVGLLAYVLCWIFVPEEETGT
ncbi:PspC domain-containing protein [Niveibacterium sp. SC-1]|uniref:PspC domain-containing protein n=1 Tax=Niveibacterium sp. SC-1 TaxID=3135646 RepID=UPI00311E6336